MQDSFEKAYNLLINAKNVLIVSHRRPDPDTLGAAIALRIWLKNSGKDVTLACVDKPSSRFSFMPYIDEFVQDFDLEEYDLMVIVDAGGSYMTNFQDKYKNFLTPGYPIINIDHHASNGNYGQINIVDSLAASTTVIMHRFFKDFSIEITKDMATVLLAGSYSDTGSFMHANTNAEVYDLSGELIKLGADFKGISKNLFRSNKVSTLKLWGKVLEKAYLTNDNVVMSVVNDEDYSSVKASPDELSGVIDYLNMVPETKFSMLLNEDGEGNVKGSFRTRSDDIDLSKIAANYGGGGHPKASGFSLKGHLEKDVFYKIITESEDGKSEIKF